MTEQDPQAVYSSEWDKLSELAAKGMNDRLSGRFYSLALFARDNNLDFMPARIEASRWELIDYQGQEFINNVEIVSAGGCLACQNMNGVVYSISNALKIMPLPVKNCANKENGCFCICTYSPRVD